MAGVAEWVCCPGERNEALLTALAECPVVHRWQQADERSAGYFALGRMQATGRPVAVVAGAGSSAASLAPAVVDAYYQRRPLLVLTCDTAPPAGGAGAPSSIECEGLFGIYAPTLNVSLPCPVSDLPDLPTPLSEGFPLHLHLHLPEEPRRGGDFSGLEVAEAPPAPRFRGSLVALSQMLRFRAQEGLALVLGALEPGEQEPALWLARTLRVPVLAEAASGLREELAATLLHGGDELLPKLSPRYILRVGDVPAGRFWRALEDMPETEVFSITRTGFSGLCRRSHVIEGELEQIMKALGDVPHLGDTQRWLPASRQLSGRVEELLLSYPESDAALVRSFSRHACLADVICLGHGSVLPLWNRYAQMQIPTLYLRHSNTTGGADGVLSTFLGNTADAAFACCLAGDLSILRDIPAAALLPQLAPGKRVVAVLNNEGAGLAAAPDMPPELHRLLVQPPVYNLRELAALWGAEYYAIHCEADLEILESLDDNSFALLELLPDPDQTARITAAFPL